MQPTDVQIQASIEALRSSAGRRRIEGSRLRDLSTVPVGLLASLGATPAVREDRVAAARLRLAEGAIPSDQDLAGRMVGRIVCDRLR